MVEVHTSLKAPLTTLLPLFVVPADAQVGKEKMHFRPPEEQNDHKVTCGVNVSVLQPVLDSIQQRINSAGVQVNIITSGTGAGCRACLDPSHVMRAWIFVHAGLAGGLVCGKRPA
jgi:hypothetical protein